jgi:hypothetical protein
VPEIDSQYLALVDSLIPPFKRRTGARGRLSNAELAEQADIESRRAQALALIIDRDRAKRHLLETAGDNGRLTHEIAMARRSYRELLTSFRAETEESREAANHLRRMYSLLPDIFMVAAQLGRLAGVDPEQIEAAPDDYNSPAINCLVAGIPVRYEPAEWSLIIARGDVSFMTSPRGGGLNYRKQLMLGLYFRTGRQSPERLFWKLVRSGSVGVHAEDCSSCSNCLAFLDALGHASTSAMQLAAIEDRLPCTNPPASSGDQDAPVQLLRIDLSAR